MAEEPVVRKLIELLNELGVSTRESRGEDTPPGYPVAVPLADGGAIILDLPSPSLLSTLDPEGIGVAILDPLGYARSTWGLAKRIPFFRQGKSVLDSPVAGLLEGSYQGSHGALYLDGFRYFSSGIGYGVSSDIFVLIVNAQEERQARRQASKGWRAANALKRLGKTLTMNQTRQPLCIAATHEIASAIELAAVLLWVMDDEGSLELVASVGANRLGTGALNRLNPTNGFGCAAEMVAVNRQPFTLTSVFEHVISSDLEAKFCYLKPGGLNVQPLEISGKLLGILELVGREGDASFQENSELFQTIAEHLALAINSAGMFENFERLASHDALTSLANHRFMQEFLHQRLNEAERTEQQLGVLMIDVDHFRSFNEEEGHDAGDAVLKLVADTLKSCMRPYDLAARYGGEEFTIIMPGSNMDGAAAVGERIRKKVEARPFVTKGGRETHLTVTIGCAVYPEAAYDAPSLLKAADMALYEGKRSGRNQVVRFTGSHLSEPRPPAVGLDALRPWLSNEDWVEADHRLGRLEPDLASLSNALSLSDSQVSILRALVVVAPLYQDPSQLLDQSVKEMESSPEFRLLVPSLHKLHERFDGRGKFGVVGNRIPMLARVLQVLLALDSGQSLYDDIGQFDPEIVSLVTAVHRAA